MPTTKTSDASAAHRKPSDDEIDVFGLTHTGKVRKVNQDHFLVGQLEKRVRIFQTSLSDDGAFAPVGERMAFLAMVADGVGGGTKGEAAARLALHAVTEYVALSMQCLPHARRDRRPDVPRRAAGSSLEGDTRGSWPKGKVIRSCAAWRRR